MQQAELTAETILAALNAHSAKLFELGARRLGLFGSFVRGEQTPDSDIDILVTLARPSYNTYSSIRFYLEDMFERKVDLVPESDIKEELRPYIMNEVVYAEKLYPLSERHS